MEEKNMKDALIKLQIKNLEWQLKVLKSKVNSPKKPKNFSDLFGIFEGKLDLSLDEIKEQEYSIKDKN